MNMNAMSQSGGMLDAVELMDSSCLLADTWQQPPRWEHPSRRSFWHSLDAAERDTLVACAQERIFWAGSTLCRQDHSTTEVMVIRSGWTKVSVRVDQHDRIIALRGPGDVVGERATLSAAPRSATVVALDDVCALVVPADRFHAVLDDHPRIIEVLRRQEYERLAEDADGLLAPERGDAQRRLASLLLELALRRGGYEQDGSVTLSLPVSSEELAEWVDARPDAVGWYLNSWRRHGIVATTPRHLTIVDAAALEKICHEAAVRPPVPVWTGSEAHALPRAPLNCSIFATDVAGFGDPRRDDDDRRIVREALYRILRDVFDASGVPWANCVHEDRGDGTVTVVPPTVPTVSLVDPLVALLAARLKRYNRRAGDAVRIQLRAALHVGPVSADPQGLHGQSLIHAARMLEARILKETLATTCADLAFVASAHVYDTVIRHATGLVEPTAYRRIRMRVKESMITSWMHLAGAQQ